MNWNNAKNLLCVRLDQLGDVLMTTPALRALRVSAPGRRITLLTSPAGAAIARLIPEVDDVITYDAPWMKTTMARTTSDFDRAMIEFLRMRCFDGMVVFTVYSQNPLPAALLGYLADIPCRLAHCRENPYQLLTDWVVETEPQQSVRHEVQRQLDLVATIGSQTSDTRLSLRIDAGTRGRVQGRLASLTRGPAIPLVVIHPGCSAASRRYPPEGFAAVAQRLVQEDHARVVFTGSDSERELVEGIRARMEAPADSFAGQLDIEELAALIAEASILIANNTGPVHIAAAVGTPVVDLYALTNPQHTPWQVLHRVLSHDVPCKYCYKSMCPEGHQDCLRKVHPDLVVAAARELLTALNPRSLAMV